MQGQGFLPQGTESWWEKANPSCRQFLIKTESFYSSQKGKHSLLHENVVFPYRSTGLPCSSNGKESACNVGDQGSIPGLGRSSGEGNAGHSSTLAWRIPGTEEPGGLQSVGLQRVRHDWVTNTWMYTSSHRVGGVLLITQLLIWAVGMYSILVTKRTSSKSRSDLRTKRIEILFSWLYSMRSNSHCLGWGVGMTHHSEE